MASYERPPGAPMVGLLEQRGKFLVAEPFFVAGGPRGGPRRQLTVERDGKARAGQLVLLRPGSKGRAKVLRVLGQPDVARDVVEALMLDRGLERRFPPGVERAAVDSAEAVAAADPAGDARRDLRALPTLTIDPVTAQDFDDAISAEAVDPAHPERARVWVHIADVSAYVRPGTPVDREAYRRGTSVYVPGAVEPMLPEALSNVACSLVPGEDRLAVTVELEYDGADVVKASFCRSVIRSDQRLDYEQVDRIFAGEEPAEGVWAEPLAVARRVSAALQERREGQGAALAIESSEPEFRFDRRGHVATTGESVQTESHRLIEHLMIAANEQVAKLLSERGLATLYRVHERPEPASAERLVEQLASLDIPTPPVGERISSTEAADVVAACSRLVDEHVRRTGHGRKALTSLVLRALKQARYDPKPLGHAGLGLEHYCHFTSPIRRYPDLICHRALLAAIGAGEEAPRAGVMEESGTVCSAREREAMIIERDADDVVRCFVLEKELMERGWNTVWDGEVVGIIAAGAFVAFGDLGTDGMLPVRRMQGDWYDLNEAGTILQGERTGTTIRLGDPMQVQVGRVDIPRGRVDLEPVDAADVRDEGGRNAIGEPEGARGGRSGREGRGDQDGRADRGGRDGAATARPPRPVKPYEPAAPKQRKGRKSKAKAKAEAAKAAKKGAPKLEKAKAKKAKKAKGKPKPAAAAGGSPRGGGGKAGARPATNPKAASRAASRGRAAKRGRA